LSIDPRTLMALVADRDLLDELRRRGISLDRLLDKPCAYCGALFTPNRAQRYCCDEHRQLAATARGATSTVRSQVWTEQNKEAHREYHRWYQKQWRQQLTEEQKARHRAQKRNYARRKAAERRAPKEQAA
jgi:hypothetical protein